MNKLRQRFTEWYFRMGYRLGCGYDDGAFKMTFHCPWWVRPMINTFFSPCAYYRAANYKLV